MLPQPNRLRHRQDFQTVYAKGKSYGGKYLRLRVYVSDRPDMPTQLGISISKKASKKAVIRNRVKRQIRAILRQLLSQLDTGLQIVVTVPKLGELPTYLQLQTDLTSLMSKAEVFHGG